MLLRRIAFALVAIGVLVAMMGVTAAATGERGFAPRQATPSGELHGEGASFPCAYMERAIEDAQKDHLTVTYHCVDSDSGKAAFIQGAVDFAGSDVPLSPAEADQLHASGVAYVQFAYVGGGIVIAYNPGSGLPYNLKLSADTIGKIFSGQIVNWDDPQISTENDGASLPDLKLRVAARSDSSGTSHWFTTFMGPQLEAGGDQCRCSGHLEPVVLDDRRERLAVEGGGVVGERAEGGGEGRTGLRGRCAAMRVDERLRERNVLGERKVADGLASPERAVEVARGPDEVPDHLVHVPVPAQQRCSPLSGVESLDLGDARLDASAEDLDGIDRGRRTRVDADARGPAIFRGVEHSAAETARGSRSGKRTQERGGLAQAVGLGRGRRIGAQPRLDRGTLVGVERVEGQRGQLVLEVFVQRHDEMPSASSVSASLRSANRMRDFAVPSGMPRIAATST